MNPRPIFLVLFLAAFGCRASHAQEMAKTGHSVCDKAIKTLAKGHPIKKEDDALRVITGCGPAGAASLATALSSLRTETDTTVLLRYFYVANLWVDNSIANASLQLASDVGASTPVRALAFGQLIVTFKPAFRYRYSFPPALPKGQFASECSGDLISDPAALPGAPLASDLRARALAVAKKVSESTKTPAAVRSAAYCATLNLRL